PAVPEPGAVRARVRLARADPGHVADRSGADRGDRLERLGRVAQVLEVAAEDARRLYRREHPARLLGGPSERLRAQDGLAGFVREPDGFLVHEVRDTDHDDV